MPVAWTPELTRLSSWLIAAVLAAIGTSLTWQQVRSSGTRPLLYGGILGLILGASSLGLQITTGWH